MVKQTSKKSARNETENWKLYENRKYDYSFKYPTELWGPHNDCAEYVPGIPDIAIENCNIIKLNAELASTPADQRHNPAFNEAIEVHVVENPNILSLKNAVDKLLSGLTTIHSLESSRVNSKQIYIAIFTGALGTDLDGPGGYVFTGKAKAVFTNTVDNKILLISYPLEICFGPKALNQAGLNSACHANEDTALYEKIIQTLTFSN
jgi:hypothetical protein